MKKIEPEKTPIMLGNNPTVHSCKFVELSAVLTDAEMELFRECEWSDFTFGDCDKSMLLRDRMIYELESSYQDFSSAIEQLRRLPSDCFVEL